MSNWKSRRRLAVAVAVVVAGVGAAAAYAAWTTSGSGPGKGKAARLALVVAEPADLPAGAQELYPGQRGDVAVEVENPNRVAVNVTSWSSGGAAVRSGNETACPPSNVTLNSPGGSIPPVSVPAGETRTIVLAGALLMSSTAPDTCQGVSFTVTPLRLTASM